MFLARYNYEVVNGKMQKVKYNAEDILKDVNSVSDAELQNFLLDMYQGVLTSPDHSLSTATPLDVCTAPIKQFATKEIAKYQSGQEDGIADNIDGFHLNPVFLNRNKKLNSGSDEGIGPMALNSTFQAHAQISKISMYDFPILEQLGISKLGDIFDKYGEEILDLNSGMINAFVDAAKDNYIGNANVNGYTYDITSLMLALGFGTDTFALLTQPIIKEVSQNWLNYKNGLIGVSAQQRKGNYFMQTVINRYSDLLRNIGAETKQVDYKLLMEHNTLMNHLTPRYDNAQWLRDQLAYLEIFNELNTLAQEYHNAIANVQVDTKKYGVNINQLLSFIQAVDSFMSEYNIAFKNPEVLYNNTFLGKKYGLGVRGIFDVFKNVLPEFSDIYVNTANELSKRFGLYGRRSKEFLRVLGPKIKTVLYSKFFNEYLVENFGGTKPLAALTYGEKSVPGRYDYIRRKALMRNEGTALFEAIKYNKLSNAAVPQFMLVTSQFKENPDIKNNVQLALSELFNSADPEIRQWANDFAVYMFYVSGGTDSNAGGIIRTTIYDVIPPQFLSNLKAGGMTFNQYVQDYIINRKGVMEESEINQVLSLLAISDDKYIPLIKKHGGNFSFRQVLKGDVISVIKGSYSLFNYDTGTFKPFIKIATPSGYDLYKLGEQVPSVSKTGLVYINPVYYRVNKIGYRSKARFAFSLRADGYITNTGQLRSLLWQSNTFDATSYSELDDKNKKIYMKNLNLTNERDITDARSNIDYSEDYDPKEYLIFQQKAITDKVDTIYLMVDEDFISNSDIRAYAFYKGKEFHVISNTTENIPTSNGNSIAIIGSDVNIAERIYQSNKDKQIYADKKVADSLSLHDGIVLNDGLTVQSLNQVATTTKSTNNNITTTNSNATAINHSGGADGSDLYWGEIGKKYGVVSNHYYTGVRSKNNAPHGNVEISKEDYEEGRYKVAEAARANYGYPYKTMKDSRLIRNWALVKYADTIFAIGTLVEKGQKLFPNQKDDDRVANHTAVTGGTGYAVEMAIQAGKPVYVFDQNQKQWYKNINGKWSKSDTPTLTKNFAGIGTRDINDAGRKAIEDVYNKTFDKPTSSDNNEDRVDSVLNRVSNNPKIVNVYAGTGDNIDLSNFAVRPVKQEFSVKGVHGVNYITFNTVEGAFQAHKLFYTDEVFENPIMEEVKPFTTATGKQAKAMGRNIKNLNRERWDENSTRILKQIMKDSFEQNPSALARLLSTGNATITHKNANGVEQDDGRFSRLLMEIRNELRSESKTVKSPEEQKGEDIKNRCIVK